MGQDVIVDELGAFGRGSSLSEVPQPTAFFPDSNLYFAPPSIILPQKKPFLGSKLLRGILIIPPAIQHPGERHIVSHSELISSESLGSEGLEGKA